MRARGVLHADFKSGNVLIDHDLRELRIIDFGYSRVVPMEILYAHDERVSEQHIWRWSSFEDDVIQLGNTIANLLAIPSPSPVIDDDRPKIMSRALHIAGPAQWKAHILERRLSGPFAAEVEQIANDHNTTLLRSEAVTDCNRHLLTEDAWSLVKGFFHPSYAKRLQFALGALSHPFF
jgi:serine/threonine protein kinase